MFRGWSDAQRLRWIWLVYIARAKWGGFDLVVERYTMVVEAMYIPSLKTSILAYYRCGYRPTIRDMRVCYRVEAGQSVARGMA